MPKSALELVLTLQYGPFITSAKAADLLSYPSLAALTSARRRGRLPIEMQQLPDRKGWYARTADIARWIESVERNADLPRSAQPLGRSSRPTSRASSNPGA
jgi:hypothetical protein